MIRAILLIFGMLYLRISLARDITGDYRKRIAGSVEYPADGVRIIGGENAAIEKYPFAVSLQNNGTFYGHEVEHFCVGSILSKSWILTTAQCLSRSQIKPFHVRAGTTYYYTGGDTHNVSHVIIHPMFNDINYDYDVGLVKLTDNIIFDETKKPIRLAPTEMVVPDGTVTDIVGWGASRLLGPVTDELRHGTVPKINYESCDSMMGNFALTDRMFCIFRQGYGPCVGDSGSPAVFNDVLIGIASWSPSCAYQYPTAYVNVSQVIEWITNVTGIGK